MPAKLPPHPADQWFNDQPAVAALLDAPGTKAGRTQRVALRRLLLHQQEGMLPTSCRFVFYEMEQAGEATKPTRTGQRREQGWPPGESDIIDALTRLRERRLVPWEWVADETRGLDNWGYGVDALDHLTSLVEQVRVSPWGDTPPPLILCESRGMQGVLRNMAAEFLCPIGGTAGQTAGFLHREVAPLFTTYTGDEERLVLYVGDLDAQGLDIEANSRRTLEKATSLEFVVGLNWERLALTEAQAGEMTAVMKTDRRRTDLTARPAYEVEALGQRRALELIRAGIEALLPEGLDEAKARETRQKDALRAYLEAFPGFGDADEKPEEEDEGEED